MAKKTQTPPHNTWKYSLLAGSVVLALNAQASEYQTTDEVMVITGSVIGTSSIEEVRDYPGNRTVLTQDDIKKSATLSIDGALQRVPGIKIQDETGTGVLPNISVRGLKASRSGHAQFLMDGVPMTLAPYGHTGQSIFPSTLSTLDRIDVVRGGAAVQYGPNNVGGVINLVTKPISQTWETELSNKLTVFEGGDAPLNDFYLRTGGWVSDSFAIQLEGNFLTGESFREHTDTDVKNFQLKTEWLVDELQSVEAFVQRYDADTQMPGALSPADYQADRHQSTRPHDNFEGETTRWNVRYTRDISTLPFVDLAEAEILLFGHHAKRNFEWGFNSGDGHWADPGIASTHLRTSPRTFDVYGVEPKVNFYVAGTRVSQNWIIGTRFVNEDIDYKLTQTAFADGTTTTPRDWNLKTDAWAAYISNEMGFLDDTLMVTPGLRYESIDMRFHDLGKSTSDDNNVSELLPGLTMAYHFTDEWVGYANGQRSLRAPQIAYIRGKGEEGMELAWNYELGTRFTGEESTFNIALYRIDFEDQLQWNSGEQSFDNIGETRHQGIEVEGSYSPVALPELSLHLAYNYLDAEQREGKFAGNQLPYTSKHQVIWDTTYDFRGYETTVSGLYFSDAFSDNANTADEDASGSTGRVPSYTVWNFNVGKDLFANDSGTLRANIAINNLFDKEYYFRGIDVSPVGRYPAPGRSYSLDLNYTF
ncbi:TonB-dependent receptor family protein [Photobacterium sp. TY1-4]|uniref:TonB-dependent receptor family protein n=1 Tax=Photobacterium sp. TY1-4 TaxID=2899122 RepID=UPI0021BE1C6D|nr:TonB-dependent siderophore receptor [Photobacterium sp. TY1-4]